MMFSPPPHYPFFKEKERLQFVQWFYENATLYHQLSKPKATISRYFSNDLTVFSCLLGAQVEK